MATNLSSILKHVKLRHPATYFPRKGPYEVGLKRLFDILVVLATLPFTAPLIAILAVFVARDGGKAFYLQDRIGRGGEKYQIWKLRTMVPDADRQLKEYLSRNGDAAAEWHRTQKLKHDPRITAVGKFLRKSSLDELPQLWNVLLGDMSLVGPRPMLPEQQDMYPGRAYYLQRPGITGSWQVSERNESSFACRARFDTDYVANISFTNDVKLLLATCKVVVKGTGY